MKTKYHDKKKIERKKRSYIFFAFIIAFAFTYQAKADVIINTPVTFASLDNSALDADGIIGTFTVDGNLLMTASGKITTTAGVPIKIRILQGGLSMEKTTAICGDATVPYGGIPIYILADSSIILQGDGVTGAKITSNQYGGSCSGSGHGGDDTLIAGKDIITEKGSIISSNAICSAGSIYIQANSIGNIIIKGLVESKSGLTGTGGSQRPGGGPITIKGKCDLLIENTGKVSSEGQDPGADRVHLEACKVHVFGLVQSVSVGNVCPGNPSNNLNPPSRPDKTQATFTAGVEVWANDSIIIDRTNGRKGQIVADLSSGGSGKRAWIDILAMNYISILGGTGTDVFAIHANNGPTNSYAGIITVKSVTNNITASGRAIQANASCCGGGKGGNIILEAKFYLNLQNGKFEAKGAGSGGGPKGGTFYGRSFGDDEFSGINANTSTSIDVSGGVPPNGTVTLISCGPIALSPANLTPSASLASSTEGICGGNPTLAAYVVTGMPLSCRALGCTECPPITCVVCNGSTIVVDHNITINLSPALPSVDPVLQPFFSFDKSGVAANSWNAILNMGANKLLIKNGATITTAAVGGLAPGIIIKGTCDLEIESQGRIIVSAINKDAGDILIKMSGNITINGWVRDSVSGTIGLPGCITIASRCEDIRVGNTGYVADIGTDGGACGISLLTCGESAQDCNGVPIPGQGDVVISGLVKAFANAQTFPQTLNRPNIKVVAIHGSITVNANTAEPMFDEFQVAGGLYDIYGGILSWVRDNVNPGTVEMQASGDITVRGHGTDPTGTVRKSFGAVAAVGTSSSSPGGIIDVRSLGGKIIASDRAFDVSGRNGLSTLFAHINLQSKFEISLTRPGANNNFNPVVDASSPNVGGRGGINDLRSFSGGINIGTSAIVSAFVNGGGGTAGINRLVSCSGVVNLGTVTNADLVTGDDIGACGIPLPASSFSDCADLPGSAFRMANTELTKAESSQTVFYPNPTEGKATLKFKSDGSAFYFIRIMDLAGRMMINETVVAKEGVNTHLLDLSRMAKGMYLLILENAAGNEQVKISVQ